VSFLTPFLLDFPDFQLATVEDAFDHLVPPLGTSRLVLPEFQRLVNRAVQREEVQKAEVDGKGEAQNFFLGGNLDQGVLQLLVWKI